MAELTVYEKPTCTTCRKLFDLLTERGIDADRIDYHVSGLTEEEIRELVRKTGVGPHDLLRRREPVYAELGLGQREVGGDELIRLMAEPPQLMQRPVVVRDDRRVLGRPVGRVEELFD